MTADGLRDALQRFADDIGALIDGLAPGDAQRSALERSQTVVDDAASDVDAADIEMLLASDADLQTLKNLTAQIDANAAAIAASAANTAKIVNIATAALQLGTALTGGGGAAAIVGAASKLADLVA